MKIEYHKITVRDLHRGFHDRGDKGVVGYGGKLDIRPMYQRAFIYDDKEQKAVIDTILKGFPLNVMYWVVQGDTYEVLDGQQRSLSICKFIDGKFMIRNALGKAQYYHNLTEEDKIKILDYELTVYFCQGTDTEKLEWFKIINIAGQELKDQEMRNAVYAGPWVQDAKRYFSRTNGPADGIGGKYLLGSANRQAYLETAIKWYSKDNIEDFMASHQMQVSAVELWNYFRSVVEWVKAVFPSYRTSMKGRNWGGMYDRFKEHNLDPNKLEKEVTRLIKDDDVSYKPGIYEYVLSGDERLLHIRAFTDSMKEVRYKEQEGICAKCNEHFQYTEMEGDHVTPWSEGGPTDISNLQMLCKPCNRRKGSK